MSSQPPEAENPEPVAPEAPPPLPASSAVAPAPYVRQLPKSPGLAAFLSLFPGLGQVYNGQIARAFVFFFAFVGSIYLTASGHEFPFAFVIPFVYLFNIIDAWKGSTAINRRFLGGDREAADVPRPSALASAAPRALEHRVEHVDEEGEAKRDDENFAFSSVWEFKGVGEEPALHKEPLTFENVPLSTRSYK